MAGIPKGQSCTQGRLSAEIVKYECELQKLLEKIVEYECELEVPASLNSVWGAPYRTVEDQEAMLC